MLYTTAWNLPGVCMCLQRESDYVVPMSVRAVTYDVRGHVFDCGLQNMTAVLDRNITTLDIVLDVRLSGTIIRVAMVCHLCGYSGAQVCLSYVSL